MRLTRNPQLNLYHIMPRNKVAQELNAISFVLDENRDMVELGFRQPCYSPPYSPDYNPIERLWLLLKAEWFTDFIAKNRQQLIDRLDQALLWVINRSTDNQRTCSLDKFRQ